MGIQRDEALKRMLTLAETRKLEAEIQKLEAERRLMKIKMVGQPILLGSAVVIWAVWMWSMFR